MPLIRNKTISNPPVTTVSVNSYGRVDLVNAWLTILISITVLAISWVYLAPHGYLLLAIVYSLIPLMLGSRAIRTLNTIRHLRKTQS